MSAFIKTGTAEQDYFDLFNDLLLAQCIIGVSVLPICHPGAGQHLQGAAFGTGFPPSKRYRESHAGRRIGNGQSAQSGRPVVTD